MDTPQTMREIFLGHILCALVETAYFKSGAS
jgi:hypothetical protein